MKINYAALLGFAAVISVLTPEIGNSESSILTFLPAILAKNKSNETFRLSPLGTQYTGSEKLSFLSIDFPDFAVERADMVNVASYSDYKKVIGDVDVVKAFSITPVDQNIFRKPVSVTVTLDSMPENSMPFYVDDNGSLWPMAIKERSSTAINFFTQHASDFLIVTPLIGSDSFLSFDTLFDPKIDGFQVENIQNILTGNKGNCLGMSLFSIEYYNKYKAINGGLYNNFTEKLHWYSWLSGMIEQNLIASTMQHLTVDLLMNSSTDEFVYISDITEIASYIYTTKSPQLITVCGLENGQDAGFCHAVVAFKYNLLNNSVSIYDPNHPGVEYQWIFGTVPSCWQEFGWTSIRNIRILSGSYQKTTELVAKEIYIKAKNSELIKIATSKVEITTPTPGDGLNIESTGSGFYIRGSIAKDQIFPPERITFNLYNGIEYVECLAQYYDQWDYSYLYDDTIDQSVTVDVDPATGSFETVVAFNGLHNMLKLEALAHVTVGGEDIQLKTNIWKADGTAMNFDISTKQVFEKYYFDQCIEKWNCSPPRAGRRVTDPCWR